MFNKLISWGLKSPSHYLANRQNNVENIVSNAKEATSAAASMPVSATKLAMQVGAGAAIFDKVAGKVVTSYAATSLLNGLNIFGKKMSITSKVLEATAKAIVNNAPAALAYTIGAVVSTNIKPAKDLVTDSAKLVYNTAKVAVDATNITVNTALATAATIANIGNTDTVSFGGEMYDIIEKAGEENFDFISAEDQSDFRLIGTRSLEDNEMAEWSKPIMFNDDMDGFYDDNASIIL